MFPLPLEHYFVNDVRSTFHCSPIWFYWVTKLKMFQIWFHIFTESTAVILHSTTSDVGPIVLAFWERSCLFNRTAVSYSGWCTLRSCVSTNLDEYAHTNSATSLFNTDPLEFKQWLSLPSNKYTVMSLILLLWHFILFLYICKAARFSQTCQRKHTYSRRK